MSHVIIAVVKKMDVFFKALDLPLFSMIWFTHRLLYPPGGYGLLPQEVRLAVELELTPIDVKLSF